MLMVGYKSLNVLDTKIVDNFTSVHMTMSIVFTEPNIFGYLLTRSLAWFYNHETIS